MQQNNQKTRPGATVGSRRGRGFVRQPFKRKTQSTRGEVTGSVGIASGPRSWLLFEGFIKAPTYEVHSRRDSTQNRGELRPKEMIDGPGRWPPAMALGAGGGPLGRDRLRLAGLWISIIDVRLDSSVPVFPALPQTILGCRLFQGKEMQLFRALWLVSWDAWPCEPDTPLRHHGCWVPFKRHISPTPCGGLHVSKVTATPLIGHSVGLSIRHRCPKHECTPYDGYGASPERRPGLYFAT